MSEIAQLACNYIKSFSELQPRIGLILGSGLNNFASNIDDPIIIPYRKLPGFIPSTVIGHQGNVILGKIQGTPIVCLQGRSHYYESGNPKGMVTPIYTLKLLGCQYLIITSAVGSLVPTIPIGSLVNISDHINMQGVNPLVGINDPIGTRFPSLLDAYSKKLRSVLSECAKDTGITLQSGVYLSTFGPSFETPAEIKAFRIMGADVVGMSMVPEIIIAKHCGLECLAVSVVVNLASGLTNTHITHEETILNSNQASNNMTTLIQEFINRLD